MDMWTDLMDCRLVGEMNETVDEMTGYDDGGLE